MAELEDRKAALIAELSRARADLARHSSGMRGAPKVGDRVNAGLARNRKVWLSGAALIGLILGRVPARTKTVPVGQLSRKDRDQFARAGKAGFFVGILKLLIDLAKPLLIAWATKRMGDVAQATKSVERKVDRVEEKSDDIHRATT
jgi:hypothetical protein